MADSVPLLGFTLPLDWRARLAAERLPSFAGDPYAFFRARGISYCEFGLETGPSVLPLLEEESAACREAGLAVALHPRRDAKDTDAGWFGHSPDQQPGVDPVLRVATAAARASGAQVAVNLHPADFVFDSENVSSERRATMRRDLVRRSQMFFAELERGANVLQGDVSVVVEHQLPTAPGENVIRIGDTCGELLEVVADCDLGLCWDTGHYILSFERHGQQPPPPEDFLRRVEHVHLHDVVDGVDHRLVSRESDLLRGFLDMLLERGFRGRITLEYAADAVADGGGIGLVLPETVAILTEWGVIG